MSGTGVIELDPYQTLDPKRQLAVRYYTDPLLPTFGNRTASALKANCSRNVFEGDKVRAAIMHIQEERRLGSAKTVAYMESYAIDAARELVRQLATGVDLVALDPVQFLGLEVDDEGAIIRESLTKEQVGQVSALNAHNKNVLAAAKERRAAAELLIAYKAGTPEQRVKVSNARHDASNVPDLSDWSKEELQALADEVAEKKAALDPMILEAEEYDEEREVS